jgi:hypothetical protein
MKSQGFHPIDAEASVFTNGSIFVAVYVDDLLIIGPKMLKIDALKTELSTRFSMTDLGPVAWSIACSRIE